MVPTLLHHPSPPPRKKLTYLNFNMSEIHPQFLQQRGFPLIPLRAERRQPARAQAALLAHPARHASVSERVLAPADAGAERRASARGVGGRARRVSGAILGLGGGGVAGDGRGGVGGRVELEVLSGVGRLGGGVELGHFVFFVWGGKVCEMGI